MNKSHTSCLQTLNHTCEVGEDWIFSSLLIHVHSIYQADLAWTQCKKRPQGEGESLHAAKAQMNLVSAQAPEPTKQRNLLEMFGYVGFGVCFF